MPFPVARPLLLLLLLVPGLRAGVPALLQEVVDRLTDERQRWAFTQLVRELDGDRVVGERLERYDPAPGWDRRWQLLRLDGRAPTDREAAAWSRKKNRVRQRPPQDVADYVDLAQAQVRDETGENISYELPLRRSAGGLFPGEKVELTLTINKRTRTVERARVGIDESFRVALGLARVIDLDLDLELPAAGAGGPADLPRGTGSAVVNKLGRRFEYQWSDFTRTGAVPPPPAAQ